MNSYKLNSVLILLILAWATVVMAGEKIIKNGIVHIINGAVPSQGMETIQLRELWRIGGEDDEFIFRSINKVLLGRHNNLYILDGISGIIYVNSQEDGSGIRQMNISGEGPGELNFAKNMFLMEENKIALLRSHPAKIVCIDYQGIPQEGVDLSGDTFFIAGIGDWRDQTLVIAGTSAEIRNGQTFVARFNRYGEMYRYENYPTRSSPSQRVMAEEDDYFIVGKPWAIGQEGYLYLAPYWTLLDHNYYQINIYNDQGGLDRIITRQFNAYKRSSKEKERRITQKLGQQGLERLVGMGFEYLAEDFEPDILEVYAHPGGNIWVRTSRSVRDQKPGVIVSYDVFSPQGHFLKQVSLVGDGDIQKDIIYFLDENRIVLVKGQLDIEFDYSLSSEADILEIVCYGFQ
ncbi:6-bladed beta-propeller [bacterium]|nr:6-bladed beta-propeller [bacterium]